MVGRREGASRRLESHTATVPLLQFTIILNQNNVPPLGISRCQAQVAGSIADGSLLPVRDTFPSLTSSSYI